ncbi:MAG: hypothetical protein ACKOX2_17595 [Microcystaceae cyanobacterium]
MATQRIALRLPDDLYQLLESHINNTGVTLTDTVTAACVNRAKRGLLWGRELDSFV